MYHYRFEPSISATSITAFFPQSDQNISPNS